MDHLPHKHGSPVKERFPFAFPFKPATVGGSWPQLQTAGQIIWFSHCVRTHQNRNPKKKDKPNTKSSKCWKQPTIGQEDSGNPNSQLHLFSSEGRVDFRPSGQLQSFSAWNKVAGLEPLRVGQMSRDQNAGDWTRLLKRYMLPI